MMHTSMPWGLSSIRSESLSPSTANFVAWYQAPSGSYIFPPIEDTLMILPRPAARIPGSTNWVMRASPKRLTSNCRRPSASSTSSSEP